MRFCFTFTFVHFCLVRKYSKMYQCSKCLNVYKYYRHLWRHNQEKHLQLEFYKCIYRTYDRKFIRRGYLVKYLQSAHDESERTAKEKTINVSKLRRVIIRLSQTTTQYLICWRIRKLCRLWRHNQRIRKICRLWRHIIRLSQTTTPYLICWRKRKLCHLWRHNQRYTVRLWVIYHCASTTQYKAYLRVLKYLHRRTSTFSLTTLNWKISILVS